MGMIVLPDFPGDRLLWSPLRPDFAKVDPPPKDIESISRLPGTSSILIAESGAIGDEHKRLFQLSEIDAVWSVERTIKWPWLVKNVEGMEICPAGDRHYFVSAERAEGAESVEIVWSEVDLQAFSFGSIHRVPYRPPMVNPGPGQRLISSLACDQEGVLFGTAAYDPGIGSGPFRSAVFRIGNFQRVADSSRLEISQKADAILISAFKVEGLSIIGRSADAPHFEALIATDDEGMGGALRKVNLQ